MDLMVLGQNAVKSKYLLQALSTGLALGFSESKVTAFTQTSMSDIPAVYRTGLSSYRGDSGLPHLPVCPNKYIHIVQGNLSVSIS